MSVHNLQDLKQAKVLTKEITEIRCILKDTYKQLHKHKKYIPVKSILNEVLAAEVQLKIFFNKQKEILASKGKL